MSTPIVCSKTLIREKKLNLQLAPKLIDNVNCEKNAISVHRMCKTYTVSFNLERLLALSIRCITQKVKT